MIGEVARIHRQGVVAGASSLDGGLDRGVVHLGRRRTARGRSLVITRQRVGDPVSGDRGRRRPIGERRPVDAVLILALREDGCFG